ncbi:hypothetical protein [Pectobacterium punjabense]|uniref:hypothetical protein n=1 Tax=Pectobacterium punjabense TaxID=2108399 RepID=UPI001968DB75|nr:hypothetical protein [Pectobacterium punjabense]MBN3134558.1 hypothetical protein [Pectobacterium punjabense]MBT9186072.1 hypothetical protein [Pectobacterium punjabense]MCE5380958.1 hypothetical protein [Pectobacterium punjabense]
MVIVTKVPLCGYYFLTTMKSCGMFATTFVHSVNDNRVSNSGVILAATSGKKYLLAHTFVLKPPVLKQGGIKQISVKHGIGHYFCA